MDLTIAVAGTPPFVVDTTDQTGISVEIWQDMASRLGWHYQTKYFDEVPQALQALQEGKVDMVVGPISITADRLQKFRFTQPYFSSSLSILCVPIHLHYGSALVPFSASDSSRQSVFSC
jgi:polar amino acid transport system substrate-binding protein